MNRNGVNGKKNVLRIFVCVLCILSFGASGLMGVDFAQFGKAASNSWTSTNPQTDLNYGSWTYFTITIPLEYVTITDIDCIIGDLQYTYDEELDIMLSSPDSTAIILSSDNGGSGSDYYQTTFSDEAQNSIVNGYAPFTGSYQPEESLSAFDGKSPYGTWTLAIFDDNGVGTGYLAANGWELSITYTERPEAPVLDSEYYMSNAKIVTTTPKLQWSVPVDGDGDEIHFQIQVDNNYDFSSPTISKISTTPTGFGGDPDNTPPYTEGSGTAWYNVQSGDELQNAVTYWWKVRGKDSVGYGSWSEARSFTIDTSEAHTGWFQTTKEQFDTDIKYETAARGGSDQDVVISDEMINEGLVAYSDTTSSAGNVKYRLWNGTAWSDEGSAQSVGTSLVQYVVVKTSPVTNQYAVGTIDAAGDVNVQIYNADTNTWGNLKEIATEDTDYTYRGFDLAYETNSGKLMVVASNGANDPVYYTFDGSWSSEGTLDLPTNGNPIWIKLANNPNSNEITAAVLDKDYYVTAGIWSGSSWGNAASFETTAETYQKQCFDVAYEHNSGNAMVVWADGSSSQPEYKTWDGSTWSSLGQAPSTGTPSIEWIRLASDPSSDKIVMATYDAPYPTPPVYGYDVNVNIWDGSQWGTNSERENADSPTTPQMTKRVDVAYEHSGNEAMVAWQTHDTQNYYPSYSKYTDSWQTNEYAKGVGGYARIVQLASNPHQDGFMMLTCDQNYDLVAQVWNGSAWDHDYEMETFLPYNDKEGFSFAYRESIAQYCTITSQAIDFDNNPDNVDVWGNVTWVETSGGGTSDITVKVQYLDGSTWKDIAGKSRSISPIDISDLNPTTYNTIRLVATLTKGTGNTPQLEEWGIDWTNFVGYAGNTGNDPDHYYYVSDESVVLSENNIKINTANGNMLVSPTDMKISLLGFNLDLKRTYVSQKCNVEGPLGYGWTHSLFIYLVEFGNGTIVYFPGDGSEYVFLRQGSGYYESPSGFFGNLTKDGGGTYLLKYKNGMQYDFNTYGNVTEITDKNGNALTFTYGTNRKLLNVTDDANQYLRFTYNHADNIIEIMNPLGEKVHYAYSAYAYELTSVEDPKGFVTQYTYNSEHLLTSIEDPTEKSLAFTYHSNGYSGSARLYELDRYQTGSSENTTLYSLEYNLNVTDITNAINIVRRIETNQNGNPVVSSLNNIIERRDYDENGNLVNYTDANGNTYRYEYDSYGNMIKETDPYNNSMTYGWQTTLDSSEYKSLLIYKITKLGNVWNYTYDSNGNLIQEKRPDNVLVNYTYDSNGYMTHKSLPNISYAYDLKGHMISQQFSDGTCINYTYDAIGRMTSTTDENNHTTTYTYDANGRLTEETNELNSTKYYSYDDAGRILNTTDENGAMTSNTYDLVSGKVSSITDALGFSEDYGYDNSGNLVQKTDKRGNETTYQYDENGRLMSETDAYNHSTTYTYDNANNVLNITDKNGNTIRNKYDILNRNNKTTDALGNSTERAYDADGNIIGVKNARGYWTNYTYDVLGRQNQTTDAYGVKTTYKYDENGNLINQTNGNAKSTRYTYDERNRVVKVTDPLGYNVTYSYDNVGNKIGMVDANSHETIYTYDELNRLVSVTSPTGAEITYEYDNVSNQISVTDANSHKTTFSYDAMRQLTGIETPLGNEYSYGYDANGNKIARTDANGNTTEYSYDKLNRLTDIVYPDNSSIEYGYDAVGNLVHSENIGIGLNDSLYYQYDANNRLVLFYALIGAFNLSYEYTYDEIGNKLTATDPLNDVTEYIYDRVNYLTTIHDPNDDTTTYGYDNIGQRTILTLPNNVTYDYSYNDNGWLRNLIYTNSADEIVANFTYEFDRKGNAVSMTDKTGNRTAYSYDADDHLISVSYPWNDTVNYTYDDVGNRLTTTINDIISDEYIYNEENMLISINDNETTYSYDRNGNLVGKTEGNDTTEYIYDYENRLIGVIMPNNETSSYAYCSCPNTGCGGGCKPNGEVGGKRILKETPDGITLMFYDGEDMTFEFNETGYVMARYVHGPGIDEPISMTREGETYYYIQDRLGSVVALTNSTGDIVIEYTYDAWGTSIGETGLNITNPYRYTSREYDAESGLYYYRARCYDSETGRFIQKDPRKDAGRTGENLFIYVVNNPINGIDPSGMWNLIDPLCYVQAPRYAVEVEIGWGGRVAAQNNRRDDKWRHAYLGCKLRQFGCSRDVTNDIAIKYEQVQGINDILGGYSTGDITATLRGWAWGVEGHQERRGTWIFSWTVVVYDSCFTICERHDARGELDIPD